MQFVAHLYSNRWADQLDSDRWTVIEIAKTNEGTKVDTKITLLSVHARQPDTKCQNCFTGKRSKMS